MWRRHEFIGWVCLCCGHHARMWVSREVHERRALRGLGCSDDRKTPNARNHGLPIGSPVD